MNYGARPLARVIQDSIKKPLSEELLFGKLAKGGHVSVGVKAGELTFKIESAADIGRKDDAEKKAKKKGPKKNTEMVDK